MPKFDLIVTPQLSNTAMEIPTDIALLLKPHEDPVKHSHIYIDNQVIAKHDIMDFNFPDTKTRTQPLITWTHIKFMWPNAEQISASYHIVALTPTDMIPLTQLTPISRGTWMRIRMPIPALPMEDSSIIAIVNIEENLEPMHPSFISMQLAGFDHLDTYNLYFDIAPGWRLVDKGSKWAFMETDPA